MERMLVGKKAYMGTRGFEINQQEGYHIQGKCTFFSLKLQSLQFLAIDLMFSDDCSLTKIVGFMIAFYSDYCFCAFNFFHTHNFHCEIYPSATLYEYDLSNELGNRKLPLYYR